MNVRLILPAIFIGFLASSARLPAGPALDARVDLDLQDAKASDVLRLLASALGCEYTVDNRITSSVTIRLKNVTVRTALTAVGESVGCAWQFSEDRLVFTATPGASRRAGETGRGLGEPKPPSDSDAAADHLLSEPVTVDLADAPLKNLFELMAQILGGVLEVDESLAGKVITIASKNSTLRDVLDRVCDVAGCRWELRTGAVTTLRIWKL